MAYDYSARSQISELQKETKRMLQIISVMKDGFNNAAARIDQLEEEVRLLKAELAPKTLDKSGNNSPLARKAP